MSKKINVIIEDDVNKKLRRIQSEMIKKLSKNAIFSVVNIALGKELTKN